MDAKNDRSPILYKDGRRLLYESSYAAIPFNIFLSVLLAIYLYFNNIPVKILYIWVAVMVAVSIVRLLHCKLLLNDKGASSRFYIRQQLYIFVLFCFLTGITWSSIYFVTMPYASQLLPYVIILVFGGMSAGATTSLAVFMPAYFAYIFSIFLPLIVYNSITWHTNDLIMSGIFGFFLFGITLVARANQKLLRKILYLKEQNKNLIDKLEKLSITDSLTNLYNRRYFDSVIANEINRAKRDKRTIGLVSLYIDNFKLVNDNLGHVAGDKLIIYFADYLRSYLRRSSDVIFRVGGDEFIVMVLDDKENNVKSLCEKIKDNFGKNPEFPHSLRNKFSMKILEKVSVSMGVILLPHYSDLKLEQIIEKVDAALYTAKKLGKNRIEFVKL